MSSQATFKASGIEILLEALMLALIGMYLHKVYKKLQYHLTWYVECVGFFAFSFTPQYHVFAYGASIFILLIWRTFNT